MKLKSVFNRNIITTAGIIFSFFVIAYVYMSPLLNGKQLHTHDLQQYQGMAKEIRDFRAATGEEALWTNSMFCGMPAYLININYTGNKWGYPHTFFTKRFYPAWMIILYMIGFFILLSSLKINRWLAFIGAFAFALSSYFIIIISAGHTSKAYAIGYLPIVAAGVIATFNKKHLAGVIIYTLGLILELIATHYQITFYGIILLLIYVIVELVYAIKEKQLVDFIKSGLILLAGTILAVGVNFAKIYTVYEYSKQTIRGPSELTSKQETATDGLDKEYIVRWSQGIDETLTLLIPNFKGGSSYIKPDTNTESYKALRSKNVRDFRQGLNQITFYHGEKPGTAGPVYVGAIMVFLFVLGLFMLKGKLKWWLAFTVLVSIVLSWGKNIMPLTSFLLDHLPMYNKFRAPDMILVIAEFAFPLMGILTLQKIFSNSLEKETLLKGLKWSVIITGGVALLFALFPGIFDDFYAPTDFTPAGKQLYPDWLMTAILDDRKNLLRSDAFRSFIFIVLSAGVLFAFINKKIKNSYALVFLGLLIAGDLWFVDKRYLNNDNFVRPKDNQQYYAMNTADRSILRDTSLSYRVLPLNNAFNSNHYSYYHKNILGYHAAKLRRPHELIDGYLVDEMENLYNYFREQKQPTTVPGYYRLINMLNAKYIVYADNRPAVRNRFAMGNAWFAKNVKIVENADEEYAALADFDPWNTALVDKRFEKLLTAKQYSGEGGITLDEYSPKYLKYTFKSPYNQLVVFSEVYYDKGWNAYIDGKKVNHLRANYMLRALEVRGGIRTVEFKFEPRSYFVGNKISLAASILVYLLIVWFLFSEYRKFRSSKIAGIKTE